MIVISIIALVIAKVYYGNINKAEDPRTIHIKYLYKKYTISVEKNEFDNAIVLLDSIEIEYKKIKHYEESYEIGVILTDKAALYITLALYNSPDSIEKQSNLKISEEFLNISLNYYKMWDNKYRDLTDIELLNIIELEFQDIIDNRDNIINKRVKDIKLALNELDRRISVTYTNLGIVKRHQYKIEEAIAYYKKAIELWEDNFTARNNLAVLLGNEPVKRSFLERMFPKKRN